MKCDSISRQTFMFVIAIRWHYPNQLNRSNLDGVWFVNDSKPVNALVQNYCLARKWFVKPIVGIVDYANESSHHNHIPFWSLIKFIHKMIWSEAKINVLHSGMESIWYFLYSCLTFKTYFKTSFFCFFFASWTISFKLTKLYFIVKKKTISCRCAVNRNNWC